MPIKIDKIIKLIDIVTEEINDGSRDLYIILIPSKNK